MKQAAVLLGLMLLLTGCVGGKTDVSENNVVEPIAEVEEENNIATEEVAESGVETVSESETVAESETEPVTEETNNSATVVVEAEGEVTAEEKQLEQDIIDESIEDLESIFDEIGI